MKMTSQRINRIKRKIQASRTRLMMQNPFFALLLMHIGFFATDKIKSISTDGNRIYFSPGYIDKLYSSELDFLLCHMVMHIVFDDVSRTENLKGDGYHHACDIMNNRLLREQGYTNGRYPHLGEIYNKIPSWIGGDILTPEDLYYALPYNVSAFDEKVRKKFMIDTDEMWDYNMGVGTDFVYILGSDEKYEQSRFRKSVAEQDSDDEECDESDSKKGDGGKKGKDSRKDRNGAEYAKNVNGNERLAEIGQIVQGILKTLKDKDAKGVGSNSGLQERILLKTRKSKLDWRSILIDFVQAEILDYSFTPPDRRFDDSPFFLPDFNVPDDQVKDVLFMIDTSGSMSDDMVTAAYSEIKSALEQFDNKLAGWVGFFDFDVTEPKKFENVDDLLKIRPYGGGGTSFDIIFEYVREHTKDNLPASIIVLTDGDAVYPDESCAMDIPVLWLLNNEEITPPWGKVARIEI